MSEQAEDHSNKAALSIIVLLALGIFVGYKLTNGGFNPPSFTASDTAEESGDTLGNLDGFEAKPCDLDTDEKNEACQEAKEYAWRVVNDPEQFACLDNIFYNESRWNAWARNPNATSDGSYAIGIPQVLDKMHDYPFELGEWKEQVDWGINYINGKYNSPCEAWDWWQRTDPRGNPPFSGHWY